MLLFRLFIPLIAVLSGSLWATPPETPASTATVDANVLWHDVSQWGVEGREWIAEERLSWFDRLPAAAQKTVTPNVWSLSRDCTGMMARFKTDATSIYVHYKLTKEALAKPHMPATGVSGIDLYARDGQGAWRWVQVTKPGKRELKVELVKELMPGTREYAAYLPLQNGVEFVRIGVPAGAQFERLVPRTKPVVFYGTSITHGVCASRPGMVHTAILGRHLDMPVVNLGFAGNGRMDTAVGDYGFKLRPPPRPCGKSPTQGLTAGGGTGAKRGSSNMSFARRSVSGRINAIRGCLGSKTNIRETSMCQAESRETATRNKYMAASVGEPGRASEACPNGSSVVCEVPSLAEIAEYVRLRIESCAG